MLSRMCVCAKFGDDQLWNEKSLADRKSGNNNTNNNKNNVGGYWTRSRVQKWSIIGEGMDKDWGISLKRFAQSTFILSSLFVGYRPNSRFFANRQSCWFYCFRGRAASGRKKQQAEETAWQWFIVYEDLCVVLCSCDRLHPAYSRSARLRRLVIWRAPVQSFLLSSRYIRQLNSSPFVRRGYKIMGVEWLVL